MLSLPSLCRPQSMVLLSGKFEYFNCSLSYCKRMLLTQNTLWNSFAPLGDTTGIQKSDINTSNSPEQSIFQDWIQHNYPAVGVDAHNEAFKPHELQYIEPPASRPFHPSEQDTEHGLLHCPEPQLDPLIVNDNGPIFRSTSMQMEQA
jgi:hypothetical protein